MIAYQRKSNPNLRLPLLDARVGTHKMAGIGDRSTADIKWSTIKDEVKRLVQQASNHLASLKYIINDANRWATPGPCRTSIPAVPHPAVPALMAPEGLKALRWARSFHAQRWKMCGRGPKKD